MNDNAHSHAHDLHDSALYGATPPQAWRRFVRKYVTFSGRASRSEFWWWLLAFGVVSIVLSLVNKAIVPAPVSGDLGEVLAYSAQVSVLQLVWALVNFVGAISLTARRLHDAGLSGAWWFIQLVPVLGSITMIVMVALPTRTARGGGAVPVTSPTAGTR